MVASPGPGKDYVIVAGLGRTGTLSLQAAFNILGYPAYHMESFLHHPEHTKMWADVAAAEGDEQEALLRTLFVDEIAAKHGYRATMDQHMADLFETQMRLFPNAKVVLTSHPKGAKGWVKSFKTLLRFIEAQSSPFTLTYPNPFGQIPMFKTLNQLRCMMGTRTMGFGPCQYTYGLWSRRKHDSDVDAVLEQAYTTHYERVLDVVPKERLLEFKVTDGWEPLCNFLALPFPSEAFPRVNDTTSLARITLAFRIAVYAWIPSLLLFLALAWRLCVRCLRSCGHSPKDAVTTDEDVSKKKER
eukprot:TRINITY_DN121977_c0_g1_i1.p1 TRINITY_DN121977_c0_g1~~TRINITY_DN121977_c0_g1_i1.p1  ORF type:complete len:300 (+),score=30.02 TRINITY_DN121977_c0_g1_i1:292-1191(+)